MAPNRVLRAVLVATALVMAACGSPGSGKTPIDPEAGRTPGTQVGEPASPRHVQIYSAVIHQIIRVDNTFGGADGDVPFDHVLIDTIVGGDRSGSADDGDEGESMAPEMRDALQAELSDLPDVRFVEGDEAVNEDEGGLKMDGAALVSLGTIPDGADRVEVKVGMLCGSLCGTWLTYVVEAATDGWKVTGTTGSVGIS
ncbi:MAG: hypothetical protein GEU78_12495 [Actinobacteria bacterium]|nr:hypothetical protein [Actinomycetota bacterium]